MDVNDSQVEDKKYEILEFLERNYDVSYVSGIDNRFQTKYVISNNFKTVYKKHHGKGAARKESNNWKDDPRVWINIHSTDKKDGSKGLLIQIKCESFPWLGGRNNEKKKFAQRWGFPVDNTNIDYKIWRGKILNLWIMNKEILTFNPPSQNYFTSFLVEAFKVYESNNLSNILEHGKKSLDSNTQKQDKPEPNSPENYPSLEVLPSPIDDYNEDVYAQLEIEDSIYQKEVQESSRWSKRVIVNDVPEPKPLKGSKGAFKAYRRNVEKGTNAIIMAKHLCEIDNTHQNFTSKVTGKNYVEAHHLIPMKYQDRFDVSIDVEANIISLCVTCHKKLHHAVFEEKVGILKQLYSMRKDRKAKCDIDISDKDLFTYYKG
ncbi:HNH endonuclease [Peribacillus simplex]|uniref:HNH endonuclease n=1 Tax=Peribacillus simplex TaxID=1478 RepID=UPI00285353E7|nr:HNH endonuclease [Peribacillus simplex]MDR4926513.1 hypothetical protein [Peribacillus simplex]